MRCSQEAHPRQVERRWPGARVRSRAGPRKGKAPTMPPGGDTTPTLNTFAKSSESRLLAYFFGRTESFIAFPTRNFSVVFAGIWIVSPVAGLRPSRAFRSERTNLPKPGNTNSPFDFTSEVARFPRSSKSCFTWARFIPVRSAK